MTIGLGCEFWKESYPCESSNIQKAKGNLNDSSGGKDDHEGKVKDDPSGDKDDQIIRTLKGKSCSWEIFNIRQRKYRWFIWGQRWSGSENKKMIHLGIKMIREGNPGLLPFESLKALGLISARSA